ncbi:MAG: type II toxin-antitoxin system RelE/ParE family toxin [Algoriphagus aquaeductus]|uniref:type II toxin-antitoxin system RelE/ParE family toxin n=1 Tax=Algoriphagus aquaeductus TaxID=475299 RepID=UPI000DADBE26
MKVVITKQALESLKDTLDFYIKEVGIPKVTVRKIKSNLLASCKKLSSEPFLGQEEPMLSFLNLGHRRIIEGNFKIVYRVVENQVIVTDFFDTRRNPSKTKV